MRSLKLHHRDGPPKEEFPLTPTPLTKVLSPACVKAALGYTPGSVWQAVVCTLSASLTSGGGEEPSCRFCFDDTSVGELISPCGCGGTQAFVHTSCLRHWQRIAQLSGQGHKALRCEVCLQSFSSSPPPLSPKDRTQVALQSVARWALRCWMYATAASTALGVICGAQLGAAIVARAAWAVIVFVDDEAARSATFALAGAVALPVILPAAVAGSYAVVLSCITAGGTFGLQLGLVGGPAIAMGVLLRAAAAGVNLSARFISARRRR